MVTVWSPKLASNLQKKNQFLKIQIILYYTIISTGDYLFSMLIANMFFGNDKSNSLNIHDVTLKTRKQIVFFLNLYLQLHLSNLHCNI